MTESSLNHPENARKAYGRVLQAFSVNGKATALAMQLGTNDTAMTRMKNDQTQNVLSMLYLLGFKLVDADAQVVDKAAYEFLTKSHARVMTRDPDLIWKSDSEFGELR